MKTLLAKPWFGALLAALLAFAVFSPALMGGFVWDDIRVQTVQLPYFKSIGDAFSPPNGIPGWSYKYFRPLVILSYMAEKAVNNLLFSSHTGLGVSPSALIPHFVTLLLHALCSGAVALLTARLLKGKPGAHIGALCGGILFALHPIHAEIACDIADRSDSMAALFLVSGLLATIKARDDHLPLLGWLGGLFFLLSLLSKEIGVTAVALLPLSLYITRTDKNAKRAILSPLFLAPTATALLVYFFLRFYAGIAGASLAAFDLHVLYSIASAIVFYLHDLFFPWPISPFLVELPSAFETLFGGLVLFSFLVLAISEFRRGENLYLFSIAWFFIALAPSLIAVVDRVSVTPVAQRYLYLPSIALSIAFGYIASRFWATDTKRITAVITGAVFALAAGVSISSAQIWHDEYSLWGAVLKNEAAARHSLPWLNLGTAHLFDKRYLEAESLLKKAISLEQRSGEENLETGKRLQHRSAGEKKALLAEARYNLCLALEGLGKRDEAYVNYRQLLMLEPRHPEANNNLGVLLFEDGKVGEAILHFKAAADADPGYFDARFNLGNSYFTLREYRTAAGEYGKALAIDPGNPVAKRALAAALAGTATR